MFSLRKRLFSYIFLTVCLIIFYAIYYLKKDTQSVNSYLTFNVENIDFESFARKNPKINETGLPSNVVPNVVHFVRFQNPYLDFITFISIKSVLLNQKPDKVYIHCDCTRLKGKYWETLDKRRIKVRFMQMPKFIFGKKLSSVYHASDVARIRVLMLFGGMFLDNDVFVVKPLNEYFKYEFSIGWPIDDYLGTQVLIAHKDARFLKLWFNSYRDYKPMKWYYNAGELPTDSILTKNPGLVHRETLTFGVHNLVEYLYVKNVPENEWSQFHTIHLLERHRSYMLPNDRITIFNENNILNYNKTFGSMVRSVLFK